MILADVQLNRIMKSADKLNIHPLLIFQTLLESKLYILHKKNFRSEGDSDVK